MNDTPYKFAASTESFATVVVEASRERPVLVDFWAPWCGPCRTLMPLLERIADDYGGRFALAKVNTDEEQQVAAHFGIRSIPTVMLFDQGKAVEQFVGVQPEQAIRALLDRYLAQRAGDDSGGPAGATGKYRRGACGPRCRAGNRRACRARGRGSAAPCIEGAQGASVLPRSRDCPA